MVLLLRQGVNKYRGAPKGNKDLSWLILVNESVLRCKCKVQIMKV